MKKNRKDAKLIKQDNGIFNLKNGDIDDGGRSYYSRYYSVINTAEFNMLGGSI